MNISLGILLVILVVSAIVILNLLVGLHNKILDITTKLEQIDNKLDEL